MMRHNYDTKRLLVFWVDLGVFKALALGFIPVCPLEETDPEGAARTSGRPFGCPWPSLSEPVRAAGQSGLANTRRGRGLGRVTACR